MVETLTFTLFGLAAAYAIGVFATLRDEVRIVRSDPDEDMRHIDLGDFAVMVFCAAIWPLNVRALWPTDGNGQRAGKTR